VRIQQAGIFLRNPDDIRSEAAWVCRVKLDTGRVCGERCTLHCPKCDATTCRCECSPSCSQAARALSTDPDRYPIESGILPLVFAMKRLRVFEPCWSCEGHLGPDGSLWKLPMVWFYTRSLLYLRLLADSLHQLKGAGKIKVSWQVVVSFSDPDNLETTFSIQPSIEGGASVGLPELWNDVRQIADSLDIAIIQRSSSIARQKRQ
jgi:hypothetical protein